MSEFMDRMTNSDRPDEEKIEELLGQFQPVPSSRFEKMMQSAPWKTRKSTLVWNILPKRCISTKLARGLVGALILILILGIAFVPPIQVIARQIMYTFMLAPSNQIEVQVTTTYPEDVYHFSNPENFPLTVDEAQTRADFQIKELSNVPEGFNLIGARFDQTYDAVILLYQGSSSSLFLTERQIGNGADVFSIGESATVKNVMIGDVQGELVNGGWKAVSTQPANGTSVALNSVNITAIWDNTLPQSTLRWQKDGFTYELRSVGDIQFAEAELIALANGLK
jgi:hypothetical protein